MLSAGRQPLPEAGVERSVTEAVGSRLHTLVRRSFDHKALEYLCIRVSVLS